jgi:hypothetical protein
MKTFIYAVAVVATLSATPAFAYYGSATTAAADTRVASAADPSATDMVTTNGGTVSPGKNAPLPAGEALGVGPASVTGETPAGTIPPTVGAGAVAAGR